MCIYSTEKVFLKQLEIVEALPTLMSFPFFILTTSITKRLFTLREKPQIWGRNGHTRACSLPHAPLLPAKALPATIKINCAIKVRKLQSVKSWNETTKWQITNR